MRRDVATPPHVGATSASTPSHQRVQLLADLRRVHLERDPGDITRIPADAIVNAANSQLVGGAGVNGAILNAGGPAIMEDRERRYGPIGIRSCPSGSAVVSVAGDLPAQWVIHAVGPIVTLGSATK